MHNSLLVLVLVANLTTEQKFMSLVATHPDAQLRQEITGWHDNEQIQIQTDSRVLTLGCQLVADKNDPTVLVPTLLVNPEFLAKANPTMMVYSEILHEYVHLRDHLSGKYLLEVPVSERQTESSSAAYIWNQEAAAYWEQWQFMKARGYGTLIVPISDVEAMGELSAFLKYMHDRMRDMAMLVPAYEAYWPYWDKKIR